jgi:hypothetical protein
MSRINDALKRAKAVQQDNPQPLVAPQLRPAGPEQAGSNRIGLVAPIVFVVVSLLGFFLYWQIRQRQAAHVQTSESRPLAMANPAPQPTPAPINAGLSTKVAAKAPVNAASANPSPVNIVVPAAPMLKLQGILYSSQSSSAMISG